MDNDPKNIEPTQPGAEAIDQAPEHTLPLPTDRNTGPSRMARLKDWYIERKKLTIPATALVLVLLLAGIPFTRYKAAGLVLKQDFAVTVFDSTTDSPVSDALISAGKISAITDGNGQAVLKNLPVGTHEFRVTKKYYKDGESSFLVPIKDQKKTPTVLLEATGRQVTVKVVNSIIKSPLAKVEINVADAKATTDKDGQALLVLPANAASQDADLSLSGYLTSKVKVTVSDQADDPANTFTMVPSGKVYFMSKRTGKLDLMKSNLDGSDAKVVLAGTGTEQDYRTSLVASADFEYIALLTKRSANDPGPQLYLVTSDDKLQNIDNGNAEFYIHGWSGNNLVYSLSRNDLPIWQQGKYKLKSYDAASGKTTLLDQSAGTDETTNAGESYNLIAVTGGTVTYAKGWSAYYYGASLSGKQHSLHSISVSGQNHRLVSSYDAEKYSVQYRQHTATGFYIFQNATGEEDTYFEYTVGGQPKLISLDQDKFYESYPNYQASPSGQTNVWSDLRDGKNVILIGDSSGNNSKVVARLDEYGIYGWFTEEYILLSKKNNELYVMSVSGGEPAKITDYQSVNGIYGYY